MLVGNSNCLFAWYLRPQGGTVGNDNIRAAAAREDEAVLLAGWTGGSWDIRGSDVAFDFAEVLLDTGVATATPPPTAPEKEIKPPPT